MNPKIIDQPGERIVIFDDLESYFSACVPVKRPNGICSRDQNQNPGFSYGTETFADAFNLARFGWPEGTEKLNAARELVQMPESVADLAPAPVFAEEGDELAVDRWLGGDSDSWVSFPLTESPRRGKIVQVWAHVGVLAAVTPESFTLRGAAMLAVIDALERAGYRVELWGVARALSEHHSPLPYFTARFRIKRAEEPLELDRVAFLLTHVSSHRRLGFRIRENFITDDKWHHWGRMGSTQDIPPSNLPEGALYFPAASNMKAEEAAKTASGILKKWLGLESA